MNNTIIKFNDAELTGVETDGEIFIALKPICEAIGLDYERAKRNVKDHPILSKGVSIQTYPSAGGPQETLCLHLDFISGWLFTINAEQVKKEARESLLLFQEHCFKALRDYFFGNIKERLSESQRLCALYAQKQIIRDERKTLNAAEKRIDAEIAAIQKKQMQLPFNQPETQNQSA